MIDLNRNEAKISKWPIKKTDFTYCTFLFRAWKFQNDVFIKIKVIKWIPMIKSQVTYVYKIVTPDNSNLERNSTFCALWIVLFRQKQHSNPRIPMAFFSHELTQYVFSVCLFIMKFLFCLYNIWSTDNGHRSFNQNNK